MGESENEGGEARRSSFQAMNRPSMASMDGERPARSSKTQSREASRGLVAEDNNTSGSRTTTKSSLSRLASPVPSNTARTPGVEESAQSEPMTRLPSTSSQISSKEATAPVSSSYGTRSRNRRGGDRPNYAEDVEMDFEMANQPAVPRDVDMDLSEDEAPSPPALETPPSPGPGNSKRASTTSNGWNALNKDGIIPGTSTFSANPTSNAPTRKRKAATIATQNIASTSSSAPPAQPAGTKKTVILAQPPSSTRETNMVSFDNYNATLNKDGHLVSDDDHVYLICEPPGDPYYIARIMEFRCEVPEDTTTKVEYVRVNWVYRPRDVQRFVNDTRLVYVTMHSDLCPLTSLRGKCQLKHRSEIDDLDKFRKIPDAFWFNQCFDRFIHRWYEVITTSQVTNVPENVKRALDERWKYIVLEASRVKELTSAVKSCVRCNGYCASDDSVDCALCDKTYHLNCVRPALAKKPARGFAWACAPCSRDAERKREARRTPIIGENGTDAEEEEIVEEEEEDPTTAAEKAAKRSADAAAEHKASEAEIAHAKMWPMRYLGIHCRVEDVLQYEDRAIYPRASSRLGPKHQANAMDWPGRPVELVKPVEIKKKYVKSGNNKKETKLSKETQLAMEDARAKKAKRPKWMQDEPVGYVHRGEDLPNDDPNCTALLLFKLPPALPSTQGDGDAFIPSEDVVDAYMERAKTVAKDIGVEPWSTDFLDRAVFLLQQNSFDSDAALRQLKKTKKVGEWPKARWHTRKDLRDPRFTLKDDEKKRFEIAVARHGSELRLVRQYVRTQSHADIVRYWYYWKKTPRGKQIWGAYEGRKNASKKKAVSTEASTKLLDDVADDQDDSAFDNGKVWLKGRKMSCKFCNTKRSRFWRRAPNVTPGQMQAADGRSRDKGSSFMVALCQRCARLWRKYAIQWEDQDETQKKISQGGGRAWKRRVDEELIKEWAIAQEAPPDGPDDYEMQAAVQAAAEPPKKKLKGSNGPDGIATPPQVEAPKKKALPPPPPPPPKEPTPPPIPAPAKMRVLPCAICDTLEPQDTILICRDCKLAVHRNCYGVTDPRSNIKWSCEPCTNDRKELATHGSSADPAAYCYECVLCPIKHTEQSLVEPPKVSHKKKTDREREKERQEKELCDELEERHKQSQIAKGKPVLPREALKRTADNKWVHVSCALWTPEIKFSNAATLDVAEGIPLVPRARRDLVCKLCKTSNGACVDCHHCHAHFHVACAYKSGYSFGFDITPVKSSRRDGVNIVTLGLETGTMSAAIWCADHGNSVKTIVHYLNEQVDDTGKIALQLFAENYKQADLTLTGTARKANYLDEITKSHAPAVQPIPTTGNRRVSTATAGTRTARNSSAGLPKETEHRDGDTRLSTPQKDRPERRCITCNIDVSPKWWKHIQNTKPLRRTAPPTDRLLSNGFHDVLPSRESPIKMDGVQMTNGHAVVPIDRPAEVPSTTTNNSEVEAITPTFDCNKCHWRLINEPEEVQKPEPEPEPVRPKSHERTTSPPRRHPTSLWGSGPALPSQQQLPSQHQIQNWRNFPNGGTAHSSPPTMMGGTMVARSPPPPLPPGSIMDMRHHSAYHATIQQQQPLPPPPSYATGSGSGMPPRTSYISASHPAPLSTLLSGLSNGLSSQHGPPLRSPTHPPLHGLHRQSESPYTGPPSHHQPGAYAYRHASPPQSIAAPRPSTPRDVPAVPTTPRIHGASASPSVHNILND